MKYLKKLFTLLVIALFACGFAACSSDDEEPEEPSLEVTCQSSWHMGVG